MKGYIAHLADDAHRTRTACGEDWQEWQEPQGPRPDHDALGLTPREVVRTEVEYRKARQAIEPQPGEEIRQCQACLRRAVEFAPR